jgi:hypothetical protein
MLSKSTAGAIDRQHENNTRKEEPYSFLFSVRRRISYLLHSSLLHLWLGGWKVLDGWGLN